MRLFPRFRSFKARILCYFLGLLLAVQVVAFLAVDFANSRNAQAQIHDDLVVASRVFGRLIENRSQRLVEAARLLSGDFAFKAAFASQDVATIRSALRNHQSRIKADAFMLFSPDGEPIAAAGAGELAAAGDDLADLIELADDSDDGEAAAIAPLAGVPHQWVVVPLLAPLPVAWITIGFRLDDELADALRDLTLTEVTILDPGDEAQVIYASTLPKAMRSDLPGILAAGGWRANESFLARFGADDFVTLVTPLGNGGAAEAGVNVAVLQRSLDAALAPYHRLRLTLLLLTAVALTISLLIAQPIVGSVTNPVLRLAAAARRVRQGDYSGQVNIEQADEIGELSAAFNDMTKGLAERDQVRDLLGKVVDPAVAEELLSHEVELGGEEREVTILFSDIRGFTAISERQSPQQLVGLLNAYLTRMSAAIEGESGVVDKYIGDAVMALFGAPLAHGDDPARAVRAALAMGRALVEVNRDFAERGLPAVGMGVGINTATVVAGNMGSESRLNYTVIGDGVNLASRIEGLTRVYGVPVIVCEATRAAAAGFEFLELDRVRVKGKQNVERIFMPLDGAAMGGDLRLRHDDALSAYRERAWDVAAETFTALRRENPDLAELYDLYLQRIAEYRRTPPPPDWDGAASYDKK